MPRGRRTSASGSFTTRPRTRARARRGRANHDAETRVLRSLAAAWNAFVALPVQHPDDVDEFRRAVHAAQGIMATRVARRVNPATWPTHGAID